jgi:hypothetical protein
MDAGDALGIAVAEHRSDEAPQSPPCAPKRVVAERAHQLGEELGDLDRRRSAAARLERERVAGQRWRHDGKCSVSSGMILWNSNTEPGQPCEISSGMALRLARRLMDECRSMPPIGSVNWRSR